MVSTFRAPEVTLKSLIEQGWAVLQLSPTQTQALDDVVSSALKFFHLPPFEKARCQIDLSCGYRPYGIEYSRSPERPDEMETFSATAGSRSVQFPCAEAAALNRESAAAFDLLERLAGQLAASLAKEFGGRPLAGRLVGGLKDLSTLQINFSHPKRAQSQFINEEHEDGHFLTLVYATSAGLEIKQVTGDFVSVAAGPGEVVAMLGGIASLMTDGRLRPAFHRVRALTSCPERTSVLFFADLAPQLCQAWIAGETNRAVDIEAYLRANAARFGLQSTGQK